MAATAVFKMSHEHGLTVIGVVTCVPKSTCFPARCSENDAVMRRQGVAYARRRFDPTTHTSDDSVWISMITKSLGMKEVTQTLTAI